MPDSASTHHKCLAHSGMLERVIALEARTAALHRRMAEIVNGRVAANERRLVLIAGEDGQNGKMYEMRKDLEAVIDEQRGLRRLVMKMLVIMATSSALGAGASHAILNLL